VRGFEVVAGVIAAFFFIGIGFGVLLMIALPALRRRRDARGIGWDGDYRRRYGQPPGGGENDGPGCQGPPAPDDEGRPPPWPRRRG
jgi:hypothetical protein